MATEGNLKKKSGTEVPHSGFTTLLSFINTGKFMKVHPT